MSSSRRGPVIFLLRVVVFLLVFTALAEVWVRTITPAGEVPLSYQDARSTIFSFDPTGPREGLYTVGRLAGRGGDWRVNNAGWISAVDYAPATDRGRPLVALFGDSFIEGFLTDADQHVDAYLQQVLKPAGDAYAIGLSGWYLEQYVAAGRYVASLYQPVLLAIFINNGDVTDSVRENGVRFANLWQIHRCRGAIRGGRTHSDLHVEPQVAAGKAVGNLAAQAASNGRPQCYFLDLRPAFSRDWAVHQRRFEAADSAHWNAYANRLVAETPAAFIEENHILGELPNTAAPAGDAPAAP